MADEGRLKERILELEKELDARDAELAQLRSRLISTNTRLERIIEQVANDVKTAARIQKLMSPVEIPHIQGFEFSTKFVPSLKSGGDYFDIFEHLDRLRFGVVVAASSGYTMSALFLSALLKISGRLQARHGLEPQEMIKTVVQELKADLKENSHASLFYGVVDRRDLSFKYCSIGGIAIFYQKAGQDSISRLENMGPILDSKFSQDPGLAQVSLNSKDRMVICSDGVLAAANAAGQPWGEKGVVEAMRSAPRQGVHELRNEILFQCEQFSGRKDPERDQTVVVIEVKDRVLKLAKN